MASDSRDSSTDLESDPTRIDDRGAPRAGVPAPERPRPERVARLRGVAHSLPAARPGRRTEAGSDSTVTARIERLPDEVTPAPLPPSPAANDADGWFEQVPTNPAAVPDLDGSTAGDGHTGPRRLSTGMNAVAEPWFGPPHASTGPRPLWQQQPWVLMGLIAATCLAVGMVLGALLFGGAQTQTPAPAAECDPAEVD